MAQAISGIKLTTLIVMIFISLTGCKGTSSDSDKKETAYQKRNQTLAIESEPASFRKYALVTSQVAI